MPSVPQSLLWISLVVLWLFVLVPMLISKRDAVRRTSDVALATRVLNSAAGVRLLKRGGPAVGHRSDPDWQSSDDDVDDDDMDTEDGAPTKAVVVAAAVSAEGTPYLDVDVVEDSGALPVGEADAEPEADAETQAEPEAIAEDDDGTSDEYEYIEDTSGLESEADPVPTVTSGAARRRYDSNTAAAVDARKYNFRKRVLLMMALGLLATTVATLTVWPSGWWACGSAGVITVLYLGYLRRQTRIEQRMRRRRSQRMARARFGVENRDEAFDVVPSRLRRPGSVVLEIDDEDPIFEHLDYGPGPLDYHLPRAAGQ